jgi:hypothetical protein
MPARPSTPDSATLWPLTYTGAPNVRYLLYNAPPRRFLSVWQEIGLFLSRPEIMYP